MKETKNLYRIGLPNENLVSVSQLQTYMSCRKKWSYGYVRNLTPRVDRSYLTVGKLCHKGMQVAMQTLWKKGSTLWMIAMEDGVKAIRNSYQDYIDSTPLLNEELPEVEQTWKDAESIFRQAFVEFEPWKYEVLSVVKNKQLLPALELHFLIPCAGVMRLHGFIDAILRDTTTGSVWCTDYKFRKSLSPDDEEAFNIQNAVYSRACAKMGIEITGTMTWQHINTPAADPAILKDGKISRSKIKTTWEHFRKFVCEHEQDPEDYKEMEEKLGDIEWFRATYEYRNPETIQNMWNECVVPAAYEINKARKEKIKNYRSIYPWNCKMCQFQSLCQAELRNYDVDAIIQREYTKRK